MKQPTKDQLREQLRLAAEENIRLKGVLDDWLASPPYWGRSGIRSYTYPELVKLNKANAEAGWDDHAWRGIQTRPWWHRYFGWIR